MDKQESPEKALLLFEELYRAVDYTSSGEDRAPVTLQVRLSYLDYIKRQIGEMTKAGRNLSEAEVELTAQNLEATALKSSVCTDLYREAIYKEIEEFKKKQLASSSHELEDEITRTLRLIFEDDTDDNKTGSPTKKPVLPVQEPVPMDWSPGNEQVNMWWYLEEYIQTALFKQKMLVISDDELFKQKVFDGGPIRCDRVVSKLNNIFGTDESLQAPMSPVDFTEMGHVCKERIRNHVREALTHYYRNGQITSKEVFKVVCKKLVAITLHRSSLIEVDVIYSVMKRTFRNPNFQVSDHSSIEKCELKFKYWLNDRLNNLP